MKIEYIYNQYHKIEPITEFNGYKIPEGHLSMITPLKWYEIVFYKLIGKI